MTILTFYNNETPADEKGWFTHLNLLTTAWLKPLKISYNERTNLRQLRVGVETFNILMCIFIFSA